MPALIELLAGEPDDDVFYSAWNALADLADEPALKRCLADERGLVHRAVRLALEKRGKQKKVD